MYAFGNRKIKVQGKWIIYEGHSFLLVCVVSRLMAKYDEQHDSRDSRSLLKYLEQTAETYLDSLVEYDKNLEEATA